MRAAFDIAAGLAMLVCGLVIAGASASSHAPPVFMLGGLALIYFSVRTMAGR